MASSPFPLLADSNLLIRWVQPEAPGYATVGEVMTRLVQLRHPLSYTSQSLGEFWNAL
jgi:hypothetical protein